MVNILHDDVIFIYDLFRSEMSSAGIRISFPKDTDPTKTYQYRYYKQFLSNVVNDWGMTTNDAPTLIRAIVAYGRRNDLLRAKGASILRMKRALEICQKDLQNKVKIVKEQIDEIKRCLALLKSKDIYDVNKLMKPVKSGGYATITELHESGKLSASFIAISKIACKAVSNLPEDERFKFPSHHSLLKLRTKALGDKDMRLKVINILKKDLNISGVMRSLASCK